MTESETKILKSLDNLAGIISAAQKSVPVEEKSSTQNDVLKWIAGIAGVLVVFVMTNIVNSYTDTQNDNVDKIASLDKAFETAREVQSERDRTLNDKLDLMQNSLQGLTAATNDRFTRQDFLRERETIDAAIQRNATAIHSNTSSLKDRVDFMTDTKSDVKTLLRYHEDQ